MGVKSKSKIKKKGPKGKKARAKAKLEQVWGEHVDQDARMASQTRVGKSRLSVSWSQQRDDVILENKPPPPNVSHGTRIIMQRRTDAHSSTDDDSSDSEEDVGTARKGGSFTELLKRIRPSNNSTNINLHDDTDDHDNHDDISGESDAGDLSQDDYPEEVEHETMSEEGFSGQEDNNPESDPFQSIVIPVEDPYEAHFSKPPLTQIDSLPNNHMPAPLGKQQVYNAHQNGKVYKVSTRLLLNSSIDVRLSGLLHELWKRLEGNNDSDCMDVKSKQYGENSRPIWVAFSRGPYQHLRQVLTRNWKEVNQPALKPISVSNGEEEVVANDREDVVSVSKAFTPLQLALYPAVSRYADILLTTETRKNREEINLLLSMHVLNHVITSRTRVQKHNRRIKELSAPNTHTLSSKNDDSNEGDDKWRDQGYTRPKVLLLFPTRWCCWKFVRCMISMLGDSASVDNLERFELEYGPPPPLEENQGSNKRNKEDEKEAVQKKRRLAVLKQKGQEWNELFGDEANHDDDFKLGMSLTPNTVAVGKKKKKAAGALTGINSSVSIKFYTEFYQSDIILASPIGLKMTTTNGEGDDDDENATDIDFLSSIEICILSRSDVLLMQNWDHVNGVLECLNKQPSKISGIDFSRVRNYLLEGQGDHWRQLIVVSKFTDPYILSTFRRFAKNVEGQLKMQRKTTSNDASVGKVMVSVKQVFQRVACETVSEAAASRLRYFSEHILPKLMRLKQKHTLVYIPSYFDFVAIRNLLLKQEANFVSVTEYARISEVSRGRARFHQGRKDIMLYTGRAHFFLRHSIKGARHVIFLGLPEYADFYPAVVNMLNDGLSNLEDVDVAYTPLSCLSLFTKYDAHQLERIVGTGHADRMIHGDKSSFLFCS